MRFSRQLAVGSRQGEVGKWPYYLLLSAYCLQGVLSPALAAEAAPSAHKIGVVAQDRLFREYERTKSSMTKLKGLSDEKKAQRDKIVSEIKTLREELVLLNPESRSERQKGMDEKLKTLADFDAGAKEELRKKEEGDLKVILEEIDSVVDAYAKEQGYELIVTDRAAMYWASAVDVTDKVLAILNERYGKEHH